MHGFNTVLGKYKGLGVIVFKYDRVIWTYKFYNSNEEYETWVSKVKFDNPYPWDAQYCFNAEKPLKEQAEYGKETTFGKILANIIDTELVDTKW